MKPFLFSNSERVHVRLSGVWRIWIGRAGWSPGVQGWNQLLPRRSCHVAQRRRPAQRRDSGDLHQPPAGQRDQVSLRRTRSINDKLSVDIPTHQPGLSLLTLWTFMTLYLLLVLLLCFSYMSVLTLIRAKEEDSGNYTMRAENGDQSRDVSLILEVKGQREECLEPFITFLSLDTALTTFWPFSTNAYLLSVGCYSACIHRGPDGHPPRLGHGPVGGVYHQRAAHSGGGVVRLQEHQTVSSVFF